MAHLITPIIIDGTQMCCDATTRRTDAVLFDDATAAGANIWKVEAAIDESKVGTIIFGICCASEVVLKVTATGDGVYNYGLVWISSSVATEHFYTTSYITSYTHTETITLSDRACGNTISVIFNPVVYSGGTAPLKWELEILSIT